MWRTACAVEGSSTRRPAALPSVFSSVTGTSSPSRANTL
jgi:hypothetical protein